MPCDPSYSYRNRVGPVGGPAPGPQPLSCHCVWNNEPLSSVLPRGLGSGCSPGGQAGSGQGGSRATEAQSWGSTVLGRTLSDGGCRGWRSPLPRPRWPRPGQGRVGEGDGRLAQVDSTLRPLQPRWAPGRLRSQDARWLRGGGGRPCTPSTRPRAPPGARQRGPGSGRRAGLRVTPSRAPRVSTPHYSSGLLIEKSDAYTKVFSRTGLALMWDREDSLMVGAGPRERGDGVARGLCLGCWRRLAGERSARARPHDPPEAGTLGWCGELRPHPGPQLSPAVLLKLEPTQARF